MQKTRLPLVMLLGLAALALLSGCASAAPTPAQALQAAEEQVPAQPVVLSATPTPTPTPEPTPTPTPTPTPEATPTPDAEAIVQRIREKLSQELQVYRNDMWVKLRGSSAYKDILVWGNLKLTEALGINYDLAQLVKQGHDVRIVWVGENWWASRGSSSSPLIGQPAFCLLPDTRYAQKRGRFIAGEVKPLNDPATFFLSDRGVPRSRRSEISWNLFGFRGRSAYDGQSSDIRGGHNLIILINGNPITGVHLTTVQDNDPSQFWSDEVMGRYHIHIEVLNDLSFFEKQIQICKSIE